MERIFAPWRMTYLQGSDEPLVEVAPGESLFSSLAALQEDARTGILWRGEHAFVILNAYPYANGHLMVLPNRVVDDLAALTSPELLEINQLVKATVIWLRLAYGPQGFNIGVNLGSASGAGIPNHVHWHVVPRWSGDTNFMTTVGDVRVVPEALADTYARLTTIIAANPPDLS